MTLPRFYRLYTFTALLIASPAVAQGPAAPNRFPATRAIAAVLTLPPTYRNPTMRRESSGGTTGAVIGFLAGFVVVRVGAGKPHEGKELANTVALIGGIVGAWVGYMVGRGKD
ncbi:MAG: hypothetical protein ABIZ70_10230 [Gemmatimonadales bacterium]